jgi:hypothetical protein
MYKENWEKEVIDSENYRKVVETEFTMTRIKSFSNSSYLISTTVLTYHHR